MDALLLARIQFGANITFHILFPTITIALCWVLLFFKLRYDAGRGEHWLDAYRFWVKIFALSFALGVVSGVTMSFQFGTNWPGFMATVGNVAGPLLAYEVLTAFFLEATFLGILLFGFNRVPAWLYVLSAAIVAFGTAMSAFWILSANSWMQTPTGHEVRNGIAYPVDWLAIVFNPSFPYRFAHMLNAAYLTTGFVVIAVGARYLLAGKHIEDAKVMMRMGIGLMAILAPLQLFIGDQHGLNTLKHQPIKVAAMEGHWDGSKPADFHIFAWPDEKAERNWFEVSIPHGSSLILTHSWDGLVPGLKSVPPDQRPPLLNVFFGFRIMLAVGFYMIAAALLGVFLWWRDRLFDTDWYLRILSMTWWTGFVAVIAGWVVTESGRQPWLVHGLLRTADAISPVPAASLLGTLALFVVCYGIVFSMGIYYINRLINKGPEGRALEEPEGLPNRPLSGAEGAARDAIGQGG